MKTEGINLSSGGKLKFQYKFDILETEEIKIMMFQVSPQSQLQTILQSFSESFPETKSLLVVSKEGFTSSFNKDLFSLSSSFIKKILKDLPCCITPTIIIPEVPKECIDHVISLATTGTTTLRGICDIKIEEIEEAAKLFGISNLETESESVMSKYEKPWEGFDNIYNYTSVEDFTPSAPNIEDSDECPNTTLQEYFNSPARSLNSRSSNAASPKVNDDAKSLFFKRMKSMKRGAMFVAHDTVRKGFTIVNRI